MNLHRVGKIAFALTAVSAIMLICLFSMLAVGLIGWEDGAFADALLKEMSVYIIPVAALTVVYALIGIGFKALAKVKKQEKTLVRERLSFYEEIYKLSSFSDGASKGVKRLILRRNILDVLSCQALSFGVVAIIDYLLFFCDYSFKDTSSAVSSMLGFVLPVASIGVALYTVGLILSDEISLKVIKLVEGDFSEKEGEISKIKEKKPRFKGEAFSKFRKRFNSIR